VSGDDLLDEGNLDEITQDVYGVRTFVVVRTADGAVLESISGVAAHGGQRNWINGECTAVCLVPVPDGEEPHEPPHPDCHCGVYAALSLRVLREQYAEQAGWIVAVIAADGTVEYGLPQGFQAPDGFRAAKAKVVAYWCREPGAKHPQHANNARLCAEQFPGARRFHSDEMMALVYRIGEPPVRW
jgi:hypothetical protein